MQTKNQGGGLTDGPFNLAVDCGQPGWYYAVIGYTANLVRATPGTTLTNLGIGRYDVTFPASISRCAYLATVGDPSNAAGVQPHRGLHRIRAQPQHRLHRNQKPRRRAWRRHPVPPGGDLPVGGQRQDRGRHRQWASLPRIRHTSSFSPAPGQYTLATNRPLSACAAIATRGSVDTAVPFDPATVEIVPGPASNTIGIQVRTLLFFGGNLASESFHTAIIC